MDGIILMGLQASGKSSFFLDRFHKTHLRLSLDMLKTRHREGIILDACIRAKQPVVIDNTNPTAEDRARYIDRFKKAKFKIRGYYFKSSLEECLERNNNRTGRARIPTLGVKGTHRKLVLPEYSEGFEELYYVAIEGKDFIVRDWKDEV